VGTFRYVAAHSITRAFDFSQDYGLSSIGKEKRIFLDRCFLGGFVGPQDLI